LPGSLNCQHTRALACLNVVKLLPVPSRRILGMACFLPLCAC